MRRALVLTALLAFACGTETPAPPPAPAKPATPAPPSAAEAREIIAAAGPFGEFEFTHAAYSVPMEKSLRHAAANDVAAKLAKEKWIALDGSGKVALTSKSQSDKRFLVRANGILDIVPLAKKEMGNVTAVRANADGTAAADFTWTWQPNEIGALLEERYAGEQKSTATLMWDGTSWTVLSVQR
jgi:hypothetical protein